MIETILANYGVELLFGLISAGALAFCKYLHSQNKELKKLQEEDKNRQYREMILNEIDPILDELAKEYDGKVEFYKLDLDKNRELGNAFGVQSIPLVIFFPAEGKGSPQSIMGLHPKEDVKEVVDYMFFQKK